MRSSSQSVRLPSASMNAGVCPVPSGMPSVSIGRISAAASSALTERTPLLVLRFEPALGVDRGHAAHSGGGDRLAVGVVDVVAAGEHAFDRRPRTVVHADVSEVVELELSLEDLRLRVVA